YRVLLGTRASWESIRVSWEDLKENAAARTLQQNQTRQRALQTALLGHVQLVGEQSSLRTDPELPTFYMADGLVNTLTSSSDDVGQLLAFASGVTARRSMNSE